MRYIVGMLLIVAMIIVPFWAQVGAQATDRSQSGDFHEEAVIAELEKRSGELRLSRHDETGKVRFLAAAPGQTLAQPLSAQAAGTAEAAARAFLGEYGALFGVADAERDLTLLQARELEDGRSVIRYRQTYRGVPVLAGELVVHVIGGNQILSVNGELSPDIELEVMPHVDAAAAQQTALGMVAKAHGVAETELAASEATLWIYNPGLLGGPGARADRLVWRVEVTPAQALLPIRELVLVDAQSGLVTLNFNQMHTALDRRTYDAQETNALPGDLQRSEGDDPTGDPNVDSAHDFAGDTYHFFASEHGRDGMDGKGMTMISTVRYCGAGCPYMNASWNGEQVLYGEDFSLADDVVAHEWTHAFTEHSSNLFYFYQSGAINESLSDVWGEFVDLTNGVGRDTAAVRWQVGEDLPITNFDYDYARDMADPPVKYQPDHIGSDLYYCGVDDNGGVHYNSGVNNKAAYLMVDGDSFNGQTVAGIGIARVAALYYEAQTNFLTSGSNYADLNDALRQAAENIGFSVAEKETVHKALLAVEMADAACGRTEPAPLCPAGQNAAYVFSDDMENPAANNWQSAATEGVNHWYNPQIPNPVDSDLQYANSGQYHIWGYAQAGIADYYIALADDVTIPANSYLRFHHDWKFEGANDGGVLEYSTNGGGVWTDAGNLFSENGYNGTINPGNNPLAGQAAFVHEGYGYMVSRLDLSPLAGQDVRFRFRIGTDYMYGDRGWFIDDVSIYYCELPPPPPTATPTPTVTPAATAPPPAQHILLPLLKNE